jgi:hypothetical protein
MWIEGEWGEGGYSIYNYKMSLGNVFSNDDDFSLLRICSEGKCD